MYRRCFNFFPGARKWSPTVECPFFSKMTRSVFILIVLACSLATLSGQPEMLPVKGGPFLLGDSTGDSDERPVHTIRISDFYLAATETTVAQFAAFVAATGYRSDAETGEGSYVWDSLGWHKKDGVDWRCSETGQPRPAGQSNYPVAHVSWNDAARYCNWLSEKAGLKKVYVFQKDSLLVHLNADGFRLPTEAEWEYAAGGGQSSKIDTYAGAHPLSVIAWYSGNAGRHPHAVGQKRSNALGISDLSGNVWEWCHDWYHQDFYARSIDAINPSGPVSGEMRCVRGGSWNNSGKHLRIANRSSRYPDFRDGSVGFRVARSK